MLGVSFEPAASAPQSPFILGGKLVLLAAGLLVFAFRYAYVCVLFFLHIFAWLLFSVLPPVYVCAAWLNL